MLKFILFLSIILSYNFAYSQSDSLSKLIIGKWKMVKVLELSKDVTERHNPDNNRWINFKEDSTFESGAGEKSENTGRWTIIEKEKELFLDSDAGEEDDSYWEVKFDDSKMYWKGKHFEFNKRFEIMHERME